jgi:hypothetical protein
MQNIRVIAFAKIIGRSSLRIPYMSHRNIPNVNTEYIPKDRSFVCLVFMVFTAWGRNEMVVKAAATNPSMVMRFIKTQEM